jgi:hypothetical protein
MLWRTHGVGWLFLFYFGHAFILRSEVWAGPRHRPIISGFTQQGRNRTSAGILTPITPSSLLSDIELVETRLKNTA